MIRLPPRMSPSELLYADACPPFVRKLLESSLASRLAGRWEEAEQSARRALEASQEAGAQISRGAALIHLVDVRLAVGRPGVALTEARRAHRLFAAQPSRSQRHNEAVAAYAEGLAHHTMGSRLKALTCYEESSQLLDRVTIYWSASNARRQATCCRGLQRWLEALSDCLTDTDALPPARDQTTVWVPVVLSESQSEYALAHLNVERYVVAGTINLAGHTFRLELLDSSHRPSLSAEADYYAIQIPKGAKDLLGAADQDYAMIVRQRRPDREGPGVLETGDSLAFGVFRRGRSGRIRFEPSDATILGGDAIEDRSAVGYVAGLLKRTES